MKFVVLQDINGRWYWELRQIAGPPVARCSLGFSTREGAISDVRAVRERAPRCLIFDPLGNLEAEKKHGGL
ncbi:YegP family protein [Variovorax sp. PAMC 28711]|uniref:YegP family protein n=1 Tax=Variovorax sp. PAMC 28711 TaxID=1795631 RepID=UPI00078E8767|nr:DUF1508 domain-containing protein [Variovorax sp. PAMC 28711]AMM26348.1 hypothetical protein AX767_19820 [Variovorax sp. PAMC 28711]